MAIFPEFGCLSRGPSYFRPELEVETKTPRLVIIMAAMVLRRRINAFGRLHTKMVSAMKEETVCASRGLHVKR